MDQDGSLLILISSLAEHTKNIRLDQRVSLITHDQRDPHIQSQGRVTVVGNAHPEPNREQTGQRYLRYFPGALTYLALQDFSFHRIRPIAVRYIGGFAKIHWVDMADYPVKQAGLFARQEEALLAKINTQQHDVLQQLIQQQHGIDASYAEAIGLDCDGIDVRCGERIWRLDFHEAITAPSMDVLASLKMGRLGQSSALSAHF